MIRPAPIPEAVAKHIASDINISYAARKRLQASLASWANREGPARNAPSSFATRDIVPIEPGSARAAAADYVDALQTALVASAAAHPVEIERLTGMVNAALQLHTWHP